MSEKRDLIWKKIHNLAQLEGLETHLQTLAPYTAYTKNKRDKSSKPICFLGHADDRGYVEAHACVWFDNDNIAGEGMKIIDQYSQGNA